MRSHIEVMLTAMSNQQTKMPKIGSSRDCKMCGGLSQHLDYCDFNKTCNGYDFGRSGILVEYFRCTSCEHIFTDFFDSWTAEEFAKFIYNDDYVNADPDYTGLRPRQMAAFFAEVLSDVSGANGLDYGGGAGIFAEILTEKGFSFTCYDPFSQPIRPERQFDVVTAFEVIEHSHDPVETLNNILKFTKDDGCVILSQTMQPADICVIGSKWWYMAPRNGHISFYSDLTLQRYCQSYGLVYARNNSYLMFHNPNPNENVQLIKKRLGLRNQLLVVGAPAKGYRALNFHDVELDGAIDFRWTSSDCADLGVYPFYKGMTVIHIPVLKVSKPELLHNAFIEVNGLRHKAYPMGDHLVSAFQVELPGHHTLILMTGQLQSPHELGINDDTRKLGLAIVTNEYLDTWGRYRKSHN